MGGQEQSNPIQCIRLSEFGQSFERVCICLCICICVCVLLILTQTISRAPGRLDLMGGISDYSGATVLQLPLREACHVAIQRQACLFVSSSF